MPGQKIRHDTLLAALALTFTVHGHAAEGETPAMPVVQVAGHYNNAIGSSDAASQGSVTAELIANRPALRPGELLEFVPGVIVTQHSGDGKANQYFLRGFNLDHGTDFATFVDGMPVNMRTHAHGQGYTDLNFLIPELVDRINYKKGPYYADEGDFASAGAAHMGLANKLAVNTAAITVGEHDYYRAVLTGATPLGPGNLVYGAELGHNNGPWTNPEAFHKSLGVLRYSQGGSDNQFSITGMAYKGGWHASNQIPLRAVQNGTLDEFGAIDASDGGETSRYSLSMRKRNGNGAGNNDGGLFEFDVYAIHSSLDLYSNFSYYLAHPDRGDQFEQSERRDVVGAHAAQSWTGTLAGAEMRNKVGVQVRYDRLSPVGLYDTVARVRTATVREDRVREASAGVYGENAVQWTPWLRSVAGLRYDAYRFDVDHLASSGGSSGSSGSGGGGEGTGDIKTDDHIVSPKLSLIFGPWNKTEYFVNLGKGFHSNDARGLSAQVTPLVVTHGAEVGVRTEIVPGLQSSLALWRLKSDSELVFVGDAGDTEASRASRRSGLEWNNHYIAAPWLLFDLDLAASRARYTQDDPAGNYIPGAVDRVASFGMTVNDLGRWSGSLELRHFGPRPLTEDNSVRSASTTLAYLRAAYKLGKGTSLALDVFNLFDRQASDIDYYYPSRLAGEPAQGVDDIHFHPVERRSFRLTLTHRF
jgi:outer membrane receptor protein involved in Fe transport